MTVDAGHDEQPVAVVTGASRGLGAGLARAFGAAGFHLGVCARRRPELAGLPGSLAAEVDVSDADAVADFADAVVARFGRIDLWVNNAGVLAPVGPLSEADPAAIRRHLEINVGGTLYGTAVFARHVRGRPGGGVLVNISSGAAVTPYQGWASYCASKAAVSMASEVTALDEAAFGLRVYAVAPGVIDTDMQAVVRSTPVEIMPASDRFRAIHREGSFNSPAWVARFILDRCWRDPPNSSAADGQPVVRLRVPEEPRD